MPTYSVFNLASACVLVAGDIHVAASTRRRNAARTLSEMRFHPRLLLGREIALGVHPPQRVAHGRLRRRERALGARGSAALAGHGARASPAPARRRRAAARRHTRRRHGSAGSPSTSPAAATRPAPPTPVTAVGCQATNVSCRANPAAAKKPDQSMPGARRAKSARVHRLSALWSLADASRVAWACASAVSSASTASARCSARSKPASVSRRPMYSWYRL